MKGAPPIATAGLHPLGPESPLLTWPIRPAVALQTTAGWRDLTCQLYGFRIQAGPLDQYGNVPAARATVDLDNTGGAVASYRSDGTIAEWAIGAQLVVWAVQPGDTTQSEILFTGKVSTWLDADGRFMIEAWDRTADIAREQTAISPGVANQPAGARVNAIFTAAGITGAVVDPGSSTLALPPVSTDAAIDQARLAAASDGGVVFFDPLGRARYLDRFWRGGRPESGYVTPLLSDNDCSVTEPPLVPAPAPAWAARFELILDAENYTPAAGWPSTGTVAGTGIPTGTVTKVLDPTIGRHVLDLSAGGRVPLDHTGHQVGTGIDYTLIVVALDGADPNGGDVLAGNRNTAAATSRGYNLRTSTTAGNNRVAGTAVSAAASSSASGPVRNPAQWNTHATVRSTVTVTPESWRLTTYLNGVAGAVTNVATASNLTDATPRPFTVGAYVGGSEPFAGKIAAVLFAREAIDAATLAEIGAYYTTPPPLVPGPTPHAAVVWYPQLAGSDADNLAAVELVNTAGLVSRVNLSGPAAQIYTAQDPQLWDDIAEGNDLAAHIGRSLTPGLTLFSAQLFVLDPRNPKLPAIALSLGLFAPFTFKHLQPVEPTTVQLPHYVLGLEHAVTVGGQWVTTIAAGRTVDYTPPIVWDATPTKAVWDKAPTPERWR